MILSWLGIALRGLAFETMDVYHELCEPRRGDRPAGYEAYSKKAIEIFKNNTISTVHQRRSDKKSSGLESRKNSEL